VRFAEHAHSHGNCAVQKLLRDHGIKSRMDSSSNADGAFGVNVVYNSYKSHMTGSK
jgi:hypothetical protein